MKPVPPCARAARRKTSSPNLMSSPPSTKWASLGSSGSGANGAVSLDGVIVADIGFPHCGRLGFSANDFLLELFYGRRRGLDQRPDMPATAEVRDVAADRHLAAQAANVRFLLTGQPDAGVVAEFARQDGQAVELVVLVAGAVGGR